MEDVVGRYAVDILLRRNLSMTPMPQCTVHCAVLYLLGATGTDNIRYMRRQEFHICLRGVAPVPGCPRPTVYNLTDSRKRTQGAGIIEDVDIPLR